MPYDPNSYDLVGSGNPYFGSGFSNFDRFLQQQNIDWGASRNAYDTNRSDFDTGGAFNDWMIRAGHPNGFPASGDTATGEDTTTVVEEPLPPATIRDAKPPTVPGPGPDRHGLDEGPFTQPAWSPNPWDTHDPSSWGSQNQGGYGSQPSAPHGIDERPYSPSTPTQPSTSPGSSPGSSPDTKTPEKSSNKNSKDSNAWSFESLYGGTW